MQDKSIKNFWCVQNFLCPQIELHVQFFSPHVIYMSYLEFGTQITYRTNNDK